MRRSGSGHLFVDDQLGVLAGAAVARIYLGKAHRRTKRDCWQTAYAEGLHFVRLAEQSARRVSSSILFKAMRTAVLRDLRRSYGEEIRESDLA